MKRIFTMISIAAVIAACSKQEPLQQGGEEGQDCVVTLNTTGEITTTVQGLTKSTPSTNDLYVVQVYKAGEPFACGVFDEISRARLNLKTGSTYDILICMVRDAKNYLGEDFSLTNNGIRSYFTVYESKKYSSYSPSTYGYFPSRVKPNYTGTSYSSYDESYYYLYSNNILGPYYLQGGYYFNYNSINSTKFYTTGNFYYNSNKYLVYYESNTSIFLERYTPYAVSTSLSTSKYGFDSFIFNQIRLGQLNGISYPTCTDWFYGEVNGYSPNGETATLDVVLKRTGFGLKYELSGVTDGEVTVKVYNDTRTFIENTTNTSSYESEEQFIAFYDTYSAWQYADNYTENMTVAVTWKRSIGVTQDLGTKVIQVKRNCMNNIKITLGSDDKGAGLSLETESESSMSSTSSTIPVSPAE